MKETRIWWVRHGPTHAKTINGWGDIPADLSDHAAIETLAKALPKDATVVSSDLLRARQTADAIMGNRARRAHEPGLRELNFGDWEGQTADQVASRDPDLSRRFWTGEDHLAPPNGESWHDLGQRVDQVERGLLDIGGNFIVVAHMGVILTRVQAARGTSTYDTLSQRVSPLSTTVIGHSGATTTLHAVNLAPDMVNTS
ncbi:MAG: histidine phosphatase family protein [Rhodobacteraceae bacterium]|nr:histidine phosphatase family protein [Paracoccaceae bacterium]